MIVYKAVTRTEPSREPIYPHRQVILPRLTLAPFGSAEHTKWAEENYWMVDYQVLLDDKDKASTLAKKLDKAFSENQNHPEIPALVAELKRLRAKPYDELNDLEVWTWSGYQLATYCGGRDAWRVITHALLKYSGTILEAMCGHMTYFPDSPRIDVTAIDFCEVSLERYPVPQRRRILCDLDQIQGAETLALFKDEEFDVVSICFGYKYPKRIGPLVQELRRILRKGGILSFVEHPQFQYYHLQKRVLAKWSVEKLLKKCGFTSVTITPIEVPSRPELEAFWHIEAIK